MMYAAWFIFAFAVLQFLVAFLNQVTRPVLSKPRGSYTGLISVLIPVRNEAGNIENLLNDLTGQEYKNIEILIYDDESDDASATIVEKYMQQNPNVRLIRSAGLPQGWLGKAHACHNLALQAKGDYLLFLDADVRIKTHAILKAVTYTRHFSLGLLSVFPKQIMITRGELLTVPIMNYILLSLLPLVLVRLSNFSSLAAANGQFMLFDAALYKKMLPHKKMNACRVEDIAIARYYKKKRIKIACLTGNDSIRCRMYTGFGTAVYGFSKNTIAFFGNSFMAALLFWLLTTFGILVIIFWLPAIYSLFYILMFILVRVFVSRVSKQNVFRNMLYSIPHQIILGLLLYSAVVHTYRGKYQWKGRSV